MLFRQLFDQDTHTYTYLIANHQGGTAAIIDPVVSQIDRYDQLLKELGLTLKYALDTHVHADHITALGALRDRTGCETIMGVPSKVDCVSRKVKDGERIEVAEGLVLTAMATPGHTDDSFSYVMDDRIFTGDALLIRGCGRTDFQNGDPSTQYETLFHKLMELPQEMRVYPAHDYKGWTVSTIGEERAHNPRLQLKDREEFIEFMDNLNLPDPKYMDTAVPANLSCGAATN